MQQNSGVHASDPFIKYGVRTVASVVPLFACNVMADRMKVGIKKVVKRGRWQQPSLLGLGAI